MKSAFAIVPAGQGDKKTAVDSVTLDSSERHRRRVVLIAERGLAFLLDLPHATMLRDGDGLMLDDGAIVWVAGKPEPLVEISAANMSDLVRISWHIGNSHADVQIVGDKLRIQRDHVLEEMLHGLGARLSHINAPFDPESGAYEHHAHDGHDHGA